MRHSDRFKHYKGIHLDLIANDRAWPEKILVGLKHEGAKIKFSVEIAYWLFGEII